jgi:hypothetical protein
MLDKHEKKTATDTDVLLIKPKSKNHSGFLMLLGTCLLLVSFLLNAIFWDDYKFQLMLIMFACAIILLIGILKNSEPDVSFKLTRQHLNFLHRNGYWIIKWQDITRLGQPTSRTVFDVIHLPYIGIKLKNIALIADNISPRLANKLIHEQRELLVLAAKNNEIKLDSGLISFEPYTLNNKVYKGPIAAWLFRTEQLAGVYGYHLYLPETSFDRDTQAFIKLLNDCKEHSIKCSE